jgi:hypothetical protein
MPIRLLVIEEASMDAAAVHLDEGLLKSRCATAPRSSPA